MNSRFKRRIAVGTCAIAVAMLATAPQMPPQLAPPLPQIRPVCEPAQQNRAVPLPLVKAPPVEPISPESDTQMPPNMVKPSTEIIAPPEPPTAHPIETVSIPKYKPPPESSEPKMGDTRTIDGQKQVYFLGFGWIEDNDTPNECIYADDMYENGNKVGRMDGGTFVDGDGDINKMVGIMGGQSAEGCSESEQP